MTRRTLKVLCGLAVIFVAVLGFVVLSPSQTLPPEKQAIEDSHTQYREFGEQHRATEFPGRPNPIPPPPDVTGIFEDTEAPFSPDDVTVINRWQGYVDGENIRIYAGALATMPEQGLLVFVSDTSPTQRIMTPRAAGAVRVVAENRSQLTVMSDDGSVFTFDIPARAFVTCITATQCLNLLKASRPLCAEGGSPKLQRMIDTKLGVAATKVRKAISATRARKVAKLVHRAWVAVQAIDSKAEKFVNKKKGSISPNCRTTIVGDVALVTNALDAGRL